MVRRGLLLALAAMVLVTVFGGTWWAHVRTHPPVNVDADVVVHAQQVAMQLPIVEPLPLDDYDRAFFGPAWQKVDPHRCDTRNEVLAAWLSDVEKIPTDGCSVQSGWFIDPYTGHLIHFLRGPDTSREVHIDHVVALADAWSKGGAEWSATQAQAFANDPLNLLPTQGWVNEEKGALDAAQWLPPNKGFWCFFAAQQILVKDHYNLGVTDAELAGLLGALDTCP